MPDARVDRMTICRRDRGRIVRHSHVLNDVVTVSVFVPAGVPVTKEPVGLALQASWQASQRSDAASMVTR